MCFNTPRMYPRSGYILLIIYIYKSIDLTKFKTFAYHSLIIKYFCQLLIFMEKCLCSFPGFLMSLLLSRSFQKSTHETWVVCIWLPSQRVCSLCLPRLSTSHPACVASRRLPKTSTSLQNDAFKSAAEWHASAFLNWTTNGGYVLLQTSTERFKFYTYHTKKQII